MDDKVTIIGAGHQGLAMAAHLGSLGVACYLWNRSEEHIRDILSSKQICCNGILEQVVGVKRISTNIEDVLQKTIMVTTPSSAHRDIAKLLAPYLDNTFTVILNPGRTFGMLDFIYNLKQLKCKNIPNVAETQTIIYTCRRDGGNAVRLYALKSGVPISTMKYCDMPKIMSAIPRCIRKNFSPVESYLYTSFGNVGMILHCVPVLMNIGWIENTNTKFEYYYDGISPSIAHVLEKLDVERLGVAAKMGCMVESITDWLQRTYQTKGSNLFEHLQSNVYYRGIDAPKSIHHRYIEEDVPNGLVALETAGTCVGVPTPVATSIINIVNIVMNCDYRISGRNYAVLKSVRDYYIE